MTKGIFLNSPHIFKSVLLQKPNSKPPNPVTTYDQLKSELASSAPQLLDLNPLPAFPISKAPEEARSSEALTSNP